VKLFDKKSIVFTVTSVAIALSSNVVFAESNQPKNPNIDALTVVSTVSQVDGAIAGFRCADGSVTGNPEDACGVESIIYPISGTVYAATVNPSNGETIGAVIPVGTINATPEFSLDFFALGDPSVDWRDLGILDWTMSSFSMHVNGSTFEYIDGMQLTGSAFAGLGPAEMPNEVNGASLRMGGCEGIREVSGEGDYAYMEGSLCLNGTFSFQPNFDGKGVSNCTLVLHDPWM